MAGEELVFMFFLALLIGAVGFVMYIGHKIKKGNITVPEERSYVYRKVLNHVYVAEKIKQVAKDEDISLEEGLSDFVNYFSKLDKLDQKKSKQDLDEKIEEKLQNKLEDKK